MSTKEKKESTKLKVKKSRSLKPQARVRPILKAKSKTEDFFAGKSVDVTDKQFQELQKRKWIEV